MTVTKKNKYSKANFYKLLKSGHFAEMVKESTANISLSNSEEVYNIIKPLVTQEPDVEQFWVIFLNSKNKVIEISCMFKGSVTQTYVYPREIIKKIISTGAAAIVCCHNHPSGDSNPSPEDHKITFRIMVAVRSIGADLHDHIILGNDAHHSMANFGTMARLIQKYNLIEKEI